MSEDMTDVFEMEIWQINLAKTMVRYAKKLGLTRGGCFCMCTKVWSNCGLNPYCQCQ